MKVTNHDDVYCLNCGGDYIANGYYNKSGRPAGKGEYVQNCCKCGHDTYYDFDHARPDMTTTGTSNEYDGTD